jgi:hypothetical protein
MLRSHRRQRQSAAGSRGSSIVAPSPAEVRAALEALSPELPWEELRDGLRPVFVRRRPLPPGIEPPLTIHQPPGVDVALGVDIGPAFMYVGAGMLASWAVSLDEAFQLAMANLRASVDAERYVEMEYESVDGVPFWWYQSQGGLASGLLLLEDRLVERYGDQPRTLIAPMRNLLLAAPIDADREVVEWVSNEISHEDPNGLDLPVFVLIDGRLSIDAVPAARGRLMN